MNEQEHSKVRKPIETNHDDTAHKDRFNYQKEQYLLLQKIHEELEKQSYSALSKEEMKIMLDSVKEIKKTASLYFILGCLSLFSAFFYIAYVFIYLR